MIDFKIDGLKALDDALKELPRAVAQRETTGALFAGAQVVRKEVIARAPVSNAPDPKYGHLKDNIVVRRIKLLYDGAAAVGVGTGKAFWARWVEFGRAAVKIRRRKILSDGKEIYGTELAAVPARPFMRPAMDAGAPRALEVVAKRLKAGIERQAKRLNVKR